MFRLGRQSGHDLANSRRRNGVNKDGKAGVSIGQGERREPARPIKVHCARFRAGHDVNAGRAPVPAELEEARDKEPPYALTLISGLHIDMEMGGIVPERGAKSRRVERNVPNDNSRRLREAVEAACQIAYRRAVFVQGQEEDAGSASR